MGRGGSESDDDDDMLTPLERETMTARQQKLWAKALVTLRRMQIKKANPVAFDERAAATAAAEARCAARVDLGLEWLGWLGGAPQGRSSKACIWVQFNPVCHDKAHALCFCGWFFRQPALGPREGQNGTQHGCMGVQYMDKEGTHTHTQAYVHSMLACCKAVHQTC